MTSTLGLTPFKSALAFEIAANLISLPSLLLNPDPALSLFSANPANINPLTRSLTQWFGGLVAFLTVPLILSWPEPKSPNDAQAGFRRATYITLGAGEVVLGGLLGWQYLAGGSGLKDGFLVFFVSNLGVFLGMRWVFLFWKRELLEGSAKRRE